MSSLLARALAFAAVLGSPLQLAAQTIQITDIPDYRFDYNAGGLLSGVVSGVDCTNPQQQVAVYIYVDGLGWFTKETFAHPTVQIQSDCTFSAHVDTGGASSLDNRATIYCAALIPGTACLAGCCPADCPPPASGDCRIPAELTSLAIACKDRYDATLSSAKSLRTLAFAGRTWGVKEASLPAGPGQNRFSDLPTDVFVDGTGNLHLTVRFHDAFWWATEVILLEPLGFGTYSFQTASRVDLLDPTIAFGAFTWDPYGDGESAAGCHAQGLPNREIDMEDSRWCDPRDPMDTQFVVQPFDVSGNRVRYALPDLGPDPALTRFFTWGPSTVDFVTLRGFHAVADFPTNKIIDFTYTRDPDVGHFIPSGGRAAFRLNLWPNVALPPGCSLTQQPGEVVLTDFNFTPLSTTTTTSPYCPDADLDGVPDSRDRCAGTPADVEVDDSGCSQAQFCAKVDATTRDGSRICKHGDWKNDEPLGRPRDCVVEKGGRGRADDRCVPAPGESLQRGARPHRLMVIG